MAINLRSPNSSPTAQLFADTGLLFGPLDPANGYLPIASRQVQLAPGALPPTITSIIPTGGYSPVQVSAALEVNSISGGFLLPRMTLTQRNALIPCNGMQVYNTTTQSVDMFIDGNWEEFTQGGGDVVGPGTAVIGDIATFGDTDGSVLVDSGVNISDAPPTGITVAAVTDSFNLSGLTWLQFTDAFDALPGIYVGGLSPVNFDINNLNSNAIFTGGLPAGSSSESAIVEIAGTSGVLMLNTLSDAQISGLPNALDGMLAYSSDQHTFVGHWNGQWRAITPSVTSVVGTPPIQVGISLGTATISMINSGVTPGTYTVPTVTVNNKGLITSIASGGGGGTVNSIFGANGILATPNPITTTGTVQLVQLDDGSGGDNYYYRIMGCSIDGSDNIQTLNTMGYYSPVSGGTNSFNLSLGGAGVNPTTVGRNNIAMGAYAMELAGGTSSSNNLALGYQAGRNLAGGANNQLLGHRAGLGLTTGAGNAIFGYDAAAALTTGSNNVVIGSANVGAAAVSNSVVIGNTTIGNSLTVSMGHGAIAEGSGLVAGGSVAIGGSSRATTGSNLTVGYPAVAIGYNANATGDGGVGGAIAIGYNSTSTSAGSICIGVGSGASIPSATAQDSVNIGGVHSSGQGSVNISAQESSGFYSVAIGGTFANHDKSVVLGFRASSTEANQIMLGYNGDIESEDKQQVVIPGGFQKGLYQYPGTPLFTYYVQPTDNIILSTSASNNGVYLPDPSTVGVGQTYIIQTAGFDSWIRTTSPVTINGTEAIRLGAYQGYYVFTDGSNWYALTGTASTDTVAGDGTGNFFWGEGAGNLTLTGNYNVGMVYGALSSLTTGEGNQMMGINSGNLIEDGAGNVAFGPQTLKENVHGDANTAIGAEALSLIVGARNTAVGFDAGFQLTSGDDNCFFGNRAGAGALTLNQCTFIGSEASSFDNLTNATAIGYQSSVQVDNGFVLGNSDSLVGIRQVSPAYILDLGDGTTAGGIRFAVNTGTPDTPATNEFVIYNNSGTPSYVDDVGSVHSFVAGGGITYTDNFTFTPSPAGNLFIGNAAGNPAVTGIANLAIGYGCLAAIDTGNINMAVGFINGSSITSGQNNVIFGLGSLAEVIDNDDNVAIGNNVLSSLAAASPGGDNNVAIGNNAANNMTGGSTNIFIGDNVAGDSGALSFDTCIFIGSRATGTSGISNAVAIGDAATVGVSNGFVLGNATSLVGIRQNSPEYQLDLGDGATEGGLRFAVNTGTPATPSTNELVLFNDAGVLSTVDDAGTVTPIGGGGGGNISGIDDGGTGNINLMIGSYQSIGDGVGNYNCILGSGAIPLSLTTVSGCTIVGQDNLRGGAPTVANLSTIFGGNNYIAITGTVPNDTVIGSTIAGTATASSGENVFIGYAVAGTPTGTLLTTTLVGSRTDCANSISNAAAFGYQATVSVSNGFVLGNSSANVGVKQNSPIYALDIGNGTTHGGIRLATNTGTPSTPGNTNDRVYYNAAGVLSYVDTSGAVFTYAPISIGSSNRMVISNTALSALPSGTFNLIVGQSMGSSVTSGANNTLVGQNSIFGVNCSGTTVVGVSSLGSLTSGNNNTCVGYQNALFMTSGSDNVIVGRSIANSGSPTSLGSCTLVGANIVATNGISSSTAIGSGATVTQSNQVMLGTSTEFVANPGGQTVRVNAKTGAYTATKTDYIIGCDTTGGAFTITLPAAASANAGQVYFVKDQGGAANTNNITISVSGGGNIDGGASKTINTSYGSSQVYSNGTQWYSL